MQQLLQVFDLHEMAQEGGETAVWGSLLATLVSRLGGDAIIFPNEMAHALSKKEMILERVEDANGVGLSIKLIDYQERGRN